MEEHINDHDIEDILERIDDTVEHRLRATKTMKNIFIVYYIYSEIVMKQRISSRVHVHFSAFTRAVFAGEVRGFNPPSQNSQPPREGKEGKMSNPPV